MPQPSRRQFLELATITSLGGVLGCKGVPTVLGYKLGAGALYDGNITTVYVPLFHNRVIQTTPYRGFENDITKAVIDEIGRTTSFKVTSDPDKADTELQGVIVQVTRYIQNRTQQNMVREGEIVVVVEVIWRDLRDGTILSAPRNGRPQGRGVTTPSDPQPVPFDPSVLPTPPPTEPTKQNPVRISAQGRYLPELGESNASAMQRVQNRLAVQIVSMMEKNW